MLTEDNDDDDDEDQDTDLDSDSLVRLLISLRLGLADLLLFRSRDGHLQMALKL